MTETYALAFFDNARDIRPKARTMTREELGALFAQHEFRAEKDGRLFSPTEYSSGATRRNAGVRALTLAVGDFDNGTAPEIVRDNLARLGVAFWIYSTHSSSPAHPKFRAVVPLTQPVPADRWGVVWPALVRELFLGRVDLGTRDASRLFYLPSAPPGAIPFIYRGEGAPFDSSTLRLDPEPRRRPLTLPGDTSPITKGERRPKLMSIAGRLRTAGAGYDAILAELRGVNEERCVEKLTERELEHIARSACRYEPGPSQHAGSPVVSAPPRALSRDAKEFDLGNGRQLRWTPDLVSVVSTVHDRGTGNAREEKTIDVIPGLFRPLRRMCVEGETYYAAEFGEGVVRTGTFADLFDQLEKVEGRVLARAFGKDVVAHLLYRFCKETEVGFPTYGFYADKNGRWVEARNPTPVKDEQARVAEEVAPAVAYEPRAGDLSAYAKFDAFFERREILPIRGLSALSPFALELRRAKVLVPHVLAWSQAHGVGKTSAELSAADAAFGREHMSASSLNSEFRFPSNVDACCGPLVVDEAERFAWDRWGGELKTAAESVNVSKRGRTSLKQERYLSRTVLFFSANSHAVATPALLVRFLILHFDEDQAHARRLRRAEFDAAFGRLAPVGPAVAREVARAHPTVRDLLAAIDRYADEIDAECTRRAVDVRDPRRSKSWALVRLGLDACASLAAKVGDNYPVPGLEEFVREVVVPVEAATFESEVTPLSAFRSWFETYKVQAIARKFEVRNELDRRSGEEIARIRPLEVDSLRGEGRVFEDGFLETEPLGRVPGDWVSYALLDLYNRQQGRPDLRFTDLKDLQSSAVRDTALPEADVLDRGAVPRHAFAQAGRQRAAFIPKDDWASAHPLERVPLSRGGGNRDSDLEETPGHGRVPLCPAVSRAEHEHGDSGQAGQGPDMVVSRASTDKKRALGTQGHDFSPLPCAREESAPGDSTPTESRSPTEPANAAATRELTELIRSVGTADRDVIHHVLGASYSPAEISSAIGSVCASGLVLQDPDGNLRWKEAPP